MNQSNSEGKKKVEQSTIDAVISRVFQSDRRIRYCAAIDEKGREVAGGMRPGIKPLEFESEGPRLRVQSVIVRAMAETWDKFHGKADYMVVHRGKVALLLLPLSDSKSVLISAEPDYPLERFRALAELIDKGKPKGNG